MLDLGVIDDMRLLFVHFAVLFSHQHEEVLIVDLLILLRYLDRAIEIASVKCGLTLVLACQFQEARKLLLLDARLQSIIKAIYLNSIFNLFLGFLYDSFQISIDALYFLAPTFVLQRSAHPILSLIVVDVVLHYFDVDFIAERILYVVDVRHDFEVGVGQVQKWLDLPSVFDVWNNVGIVQ